MPPSLQHDSETTERLLAQAATGDEQAFTQLMERHLPAIRESIHRRLPTRLRPRADASDIIQETQQAAFRRLADFVDRRPMSFRLWLLKTAHERLIDLQRHHLRRAKRTMDRELPLPERSSLALAAQLIGEQPSPSDMASRRELARAVHRALAGLSANDAEILMLRCFDGLSNREAAALLEIEPETAKKRFARSLLRLRRLLREEGIDGADE